MWKWAVALGLSLGSAAEAEVQKAIVAGGCFWCVESDFEGLPGVIEAVSGYTGGSRENPTYRNHEGHYEAVEITFDSSAVTYDQLIRLFLRSVDVTDAGGQFCDRGDSYRTAIFALDAGQKRAAQAAVAEAEAALGVTVVTPVLDAGTFWIAEDYHQDYYKGSNIILTRAGPKKQSNAYKFYRDSCGRDARVREVWGAEAFPGK
ncbi:MAG: peptide-methionine (S)-S-oxide reductase MsrA [Tabrizicola sp.]|jgi:peptide-methionine (S)-S-oxide reductase|nr:peptide-methionine (S)-S-oxide reductase MsrA [Tabrizicola sp.]